MKRRSTPTQKTRGKSPYNKCKKASYNYSTMYANLPHDSELRRHRLKRRQAEA